MSKRKENIRKACDEIDLLLDLLNKRVTPFHIVYRQIKDLTHRIKRTTWRGDENKLDKKITDDIKRIAMRSFNNDFSNVKLNNDHSPATDY